MITKKGYINRIIFKSPDNAYKIIELACEDEDIVCLGSMPGVDLGELIEVTGQIEMNPEHGPQLRVETYNPVPPDDPESIKRYLGSGAISGIGPKMAEKIVKAFGSRTMDILENEPERLAEIKGISERKAREFAIQFAEKREARAAFMFLQQDYGISNNMAVRIYEEYGNSIYSIMKQNPYRLAEDIRGIGFRMADNIARRAGIEVDSQYRIKSGILYILMEAAGEGHMYLPENILISKAEDLLELQQDAIKTEIDNLKMERKIIVKLENGNGQQNQGGWQSGTDQTQVYIQSFYFAELQCAAMLHDLNLRVAEDMLPAQQTEIDKKINILEAKLSLEFDELQRKAVFEAATCGILILSGGPGTGKTTTINAMINYFYDEGMDIMLAAPTGRAAKRMTEATGIEAKTIHRLLELSGAPDDDRSRARFERNEENPLETDVLIIDEMSMVDIFLFQSLLKAITPGTRLILVGDVDQLPSVGAGQVLADMIASKAFTVITLEKIFRQAEGSDIVMNAHAIRQGKYPKINNKDSRDFFFMPRNDVNVIYKHMIQLINENLPKFYKIKPYDIQVLTPMRKGTLGVETLNSILQKYINPQSDSKTEIEAGGRIFRQGDKVMQIKNNYQLEWEVIGKYNIATDSGMGVFNGDMGIICSIDESARTLTVEYDENRRVLYNFTQMDEIDLAYAITIHKSQGSEYPAVILPLLSGPPALFNRNLLYTAITRAKSCLTIMGQEKTVRDMVDNDHVNKRYTGLKDRIIEVCF